MKTSSSFIFFLALFLFRLICIVSVSAAADVYSPSDSILVNCGSPEDAKDADGRKWIASTSSMIRLISNGSTQATAGFEDPSLPSGVPYMTAVVFTRESTFKFTVKKTDRHWVRLHFYPAVYNGLNPEDAFFDVKISGGVTLLKNFSAAITAKALTQAYIVKEYSLAPSADGLLTLTFTPSTTHENSYAFVNGIEIISMPDLYTEPAAMVGFSDQTMQVGRSALQTMYRLNVGGQYVSANNDTGFSRTWYDDSPYVYGANFGITMAAPSNLTIDYPDSSSRYAAPVDVYGTSRSMGPESKININSNLTWVFMVDANFTYLIRFHFCELLMEKINQRVFNIYINNQTAQEAADVLGWTSSKGVPTYKDFAMFVSDGPGDEQLWIALHPNTQSKPEYYDASLNGLEIFKMSDSAGNLAGPNPVPSEMLLQEEAESPMAGFASNTNAGSSKISQTTTGGVAAVGLFFVICVAVYQRKKREVGVHDTSVSGWLPVYGNHSTTNMSKSGKSTGSCHLSALAQGLCRHFSLSEITLATKNFSESLVIGVGGFGKVYRGVIDGNTKVAIKRSNPSSEQGVNEFQTEIEMLSKLRHRHLVSLIGFCEENNEMVLVYDYMAHGTLREHLYKTNNPPLSWKQRLEICIGAARGLHYLHTGAKYPIIHRDVKTTNILLDEQWVAKVSDFGLSKTGPSMNQTHVSTMVKGSFGYLDPEYYRRQQLTEKSDVYSFGVVLFEVLCARPALMTNGPREQLSLAEWALQNQRKGTFNNIIDPHLKGKINDECLKKFAETAEKCLSENGVDRPSMGDVLWNLEFALQMQEGEGSVNSSVKSDHVRSASTASSVVDGGGEAVEKPDDLDPREFSEIVGR